MKPSAIDSIVIHCSATPEGMDFRERDIDRMHKERGFKEIGYHYVIDIDGTIEVGRATTKAGAHCADKGFSGKPYNSYNPIIPCGFTNSLGNKTGVVTFTLTEAQAEAYGSVHSESVPSYRGVENPFGHIYKWTDGFLAKGLGDDAGYQEVYISRKRSQYSSTLNDSYKDMGHDAAANGYVKAILASNPSLSQDFRKHGDLIGTDDSGSASTYFCDYHYTAHALNTIYGASVGGNANNGTNDGFACVASDSAPSRALASLGSRLCFCDSDFNE